MCFKCLCMLPVTGCSNMPLNMSWQPYEPLGCWVGEEQRSRRERRWEAWPCRWFSQWSNRNYSSEPALQTGGYQQACAHSCSPFFFFTSSSVSFRASVGFTRSFILYLSRAEWDWTWCVWEKVAWFVCKCVCVRERGFFSSDTAAVLTDVSMSQGGGSIACNILWIIFPPHMQIW